MKNQAVGAMRDSGDLFLGALFKSGSGQALTDHDFPVETGHFSQVITITSVEIQSTGWS